MRRIVSRVARISKRGNAGMQERSGWTKPGTPLDRAVKKHGPLNGWWGQRVEGDRSKPVYNKAREVERRLRQMPDDGYGRVYAVKGIVSGPFIPAY